jgi:hypothetical protein
MYKVDPKTLACFNPDQQTIIALIRPQTGQVRMDQQRCGILTADPAWLGSAGRVDVDGTWIWHVWIDVATFVYKSTPASIVEELTCSMPKERIENQGRLRGAKVNASWLESSWSFVLGWQAGQGWGIGYGPRTEAAGEASYLSSLHQRSRPRVRLENLVPGEGLFPLKWRSLDVGLGTSLVIQEVRD